MIRDLDYFFNYFNYVFIKLNKNLTRVLTFHNFIDT